MARFHSALSATHSIQTRNSFSAREGQKGKTMKLSKLLAALVVALALFALSHEATAQVPCNQCGQLSTPKDVRDCMKNCTTPPQPTGTGTGTSKPPAQATKVCWDKSVVPVSNPCPPKTGGTLTCGANEHVDGRQCVCDVQVGCGKPCPRPCNEPAGEYRDLKGECVKVEAKGLTWTCDDGQLMAVDGACITPPPPPCHTVDDNHKAVMEVLSGLAGWRWTLLLILLLIGVMIEIPVGLYVLYRKLRPASPPPPPKTEGGTPDGPTVEGVKDALIKKPPQAAKRAAF